MEFVGVVISCQEYSLSMNKSALDAIPTTTTIAVSVIIAAALIALPMASTGKVAFAVNQTKSGNNTGGSTTGGIKASILQGAPNLGDKAFSPNPINVKVGGTVTWTNKDTIGHTVTSGTGPSDPNKGKEFDSGLSTLLTPGKTFSHTFNTAGAFTYFCQVHPTMMGKVVVS